MSANTTIASAVAIRVAIVGHTNTGKTSLIRTLLRNDHFGQIDDIAGTTRSVEKTAIYADDAVILELFDTPGFEDSSALLETLEQLAPARPSQPPAELLRHFIQQSDDFMEFDQEIKVLRQSLNSDVLLYVIDVREPLLGKYRDEVEILSKAGKPILPVFNFIQGHSEALQRWREQMTHFNLHAALEFDTVAFDFEAEKRLYQKLQSLLEPHYESLQSLIDYRQAVWQNLNQAAARRIFQLIREVACYRVETKGNKNASHKRAQGVVLEQDEVARMQDFVRDAEQRTLTDLQAIFEFTQLDLDLQQLPVQDGSWALDIFSPQVMKEFGLDLGSSALSGAAVGAGIDLMVGGLSLGAASLLGAAVGAGWATAKRYQQELLAAWRGHKWLCVDDNTISLLYLRQRQLLKALTHRGHAAQGRIKLANEQTSQLPRQWNELLQTLRQNPQWQNSMVYDSELEAIQQQMLQWLLAE